MVDDDEDWEITPCYPRAVVHGICRVCGNEFTPRRKNHFTCSEPCSLKLRNRLIARWAKSHPEKIKDIQQRYIEANIEKIREVSRRSKAASRAADPEKDRAYQREWRALHATEINAARRDRYANDPEFREKKDAYDRAYVKANPEEVRARQKKWEAANREKTRAYSHKSYLRHRDAILERIRKYQEANPEKVAERHRRYKITNAEFVYAGQKRWRAEHPEKARGYTEKWKSNNAQTVKEKAHQAYLKKAAIIRCYQELVGYATSDDWKNYATIKRTLEQQLGESL